MPCCVVCRVSWSWALQYVGKCSGEYAGEEPVATRACGSRPCYGGGHVWRVGAWTECSYSCGGGTMSRDVQCYSPTGPVDVDSLDACETSSGSPSPPPAAHSTCNNHPCGGYATAESPYYNDPYCASAVYDAAGECCAAGRVDRCGVCGGAGHVTDLNGACCAGGIEAVLGADGLCCDSG